MIFDAIIDHCVDSTEVKDGDTFITTSRGGRRSRLTTKGWGILV